MHDEVVAHFHRQIMRRVSLRPALQCAKWPGQIAARQFFASFFGAVIIDQSSVRNGVAGNTGC